MEKQTAGRNILGNLASKFAELNDDILFDEVWSREDTSNEWLEPVSDEEYWKII